MPWERRWNVVALIGVVAASGGFAVGASRPALALLNGRGTVEVNGLPAQPGMTLFAGDHVITGGDSLAVLSPVSGGIVQVGQSTELDLESSGGARFELRQGAVMVRSGKAGLTTVDLDGAAVSAEAERGFPAICRVAVVGRSAAVVSDRGRVSVRAGGAAIALRPGQAMRLEDGVPQASGQLAGHVSGEIPKSQVQRQGQGAELPLGVNDSVDWNDVVRTVQAGRVRLELLDGSFLNVGARSVMRIVQHDPQTQQTQIELTLGRMRGEVKKLTAAGASFQVRTPTAVIGVVGTTFVVEAEKSLTQACSFEGLVSVRNINPAVAGQVTLHPGECALVRLGKAAELTAAARGLARLMNQTNVASGVAKSAAVSRTVLSAGRLSVAGLSAALGGVAVSRLGGTTSALQQSNGALQQANSNLGSAANAANAALNAALGALANSGALGKGISNFFSGLKISPSKPCPDC